MYVPEMILSSNFNITFPYLKDTSLPLHNHEPTWYGQYHRLHISLQNRSLTKTKILYYSLYIVCVVSIWPFSTAISLNCLYLSVTRISPKEADCKIKELKHICIMMIGKYFTIAVCTENYLSAYYPPL